MSKALILVIFLCGEKHDNTTYMIEYSNHQNALVLNKYKREKDPADGRNCFAMCWKMIIRSSI